MARANKYRNDIGIAAQLRPAAKSFIKEALRIYGAAEEALTAAGQQLEDLVSETRAEMKKTRSLRRGNRHKDKS